MSGALSELLMREVVDDGGGPSGVAPGPDAPGAPQVARIVGRATDVLADGSRRHSFLLFEPPRSYSWLTEAGMRADSALHAILDAYPGEKGDDPSGNGFVVVVLRARGPTGRRQYRVRWTVEQQVPVRYAEEHNYGWLLRRELVNPDLAYAFDRPQRDEDASGDEDGDDGGGGGGDSGACGAEAESQDAGVGGPSGGPSALKWSQAQGRPLLSMRRAVAQHGGAHLGALWEYTASRLFALRCRAPPAPGRPGAPTNDELEQVGKDMYEVDRKALDAVFRREREQGTRERLLAADDEDGDEEAALAAWRAEREADLRADAEARWKAVRDEDAPYMTKLEAQLAAIEALEAAGGDVEAVPPATVDLLSDAAALILTGWATDRNEAAASISQPRLRLPRIRDVLSQPSRSEVADGWLKLLRSVHSNTLPAERLASAYGTSWPKRPGPTATPPDHVVATRSLRMGAGLVIEHGDPAQNPTNLALCTLSQNSAKSDSVLGLFSAPDDMQGAAGQDVYSPGGVSENKKAMLAKAVAMVFALYWGALAQPRVGPVARWCVWCVWCALTPSSVHSAPPQGSATRSVPPALVLTTRVAPALKFMRARGRMAPSRSLYDDPHRRLNAGMPFSQPPCRSGARATHWPLTAACSIGDSSAFWLHASKAPTSSRSSSAPRCRLAWPRHRADGVAAGKSHLPFSGPQSGNVRKPSGNRPEVVHPPDAFRTLRRRDRTTYNEAATHTHTSAAAAFSIMRPHCSSLTRAQLAKTLSVSVGTLWRRARACQRSSPR